MVSRILKAGPKRVLALLFLFLFLLTVLMLAAPDSQARNPYTYTDDAEGDPGDGVLQPGPESEPEPVFTPKGFSYPLVAITLVDLGDGHFLPVFALNNLAGMPTFLPPSHLRRNPSDGRWHRAP